MRTEQDIVPILENYIMLNDTSNYSEMESISPGL